MDVTKAATHGKKSVISEHEVNDSEHEVNDLRKASRRVNKSLYQ